MRLFRLWQRNCVSLNGLPATQNGALKTLRKIVGLDEGSRRQRGGTRKPKLILDETLKGIQKALTQLFEVETGCKMPKQMKRMSTIIALIKHDGLAVAYKDPKGSGYHVNLRPAVHDLPRAGRRINQRAAAKLDAKGEDCQPGLGLRLILVLVA